VFAKDGLAEGLAFNEGNGLVAADQVLGGVGEPANTAEGVKETEHHAPLDK
jgi:hypothetical protein